MTIVSGGCHCGAVRFTAKPGGGMHACHCPTCRRISGGILFSVECGTSVVVEGEVATYASSEWAVRDFCPNCGSGLFWRLNEGGLTMVSAMAFDDPTPFVLEDEVCIEHKLDSYALAGERPRLTTEELWAQAEPREG